MIPALPYCMIVMQDSELLIYLLTFVRGCIFKNKQKRRIDNNYDSNSNPKYWTADAYMQWCNDAYPADM